MKVPLLGPTRQHPQRNLTISFLTLPDPPRFLTSLLSVEARCNRLKRTARDLVQSLQNELEAELMKLPKRIRTMPLDEFRSAAFCGSVTKVNNHHNHDPIFALLTALVLNPE